MKLNKVHHIAIICSDYERSLTVYTQTLGLRLIAEHYRSERQSYKADLALGTDTLLNSFSLSQSAGAAHTPRSSRTATSAFETDNIVQAVAELDSLQVPHEPIRIDEYTQKKFVFFQDPDGLPIELSEK